MITLKDITFDENSKKEVFNFLQKQPRYCSIRLFKIHFYNLFDELEKKQFPSYFSFPQKVYHFLQDDDLFDLGHCCICGNRCTFISISRGYNKYCSTNCSHKDPHTRELMKQTRFKKNGGKYLSDDELTKRRNTIQSMSEEYKQSIKDKRKKTNLERFGVENVMNNDEIKKKAFSTIIDKYGGIGNASSELKSKQELTMENRYGVKHNWQSKNELLNGQKTRNELYGNKNYVCTEDFLNYMKGITEERNDKIVETKRKNHTFNTSQIEEDLNNYLLSLCVNFKRQYKDDRYPFSCDFYLPENDLFIELNGLWTHGGKPFEGTDDDIKKIEYWKSKNNDYYNNAIETWTIRDVNKRKYAKDNNLNYIEIFSNNIDEIIDIVNSVIWRKM